VAIIGSPPLLDGNWRRQGTRKQSGKTEIRPSFFFMMYISFAVKIHRSTITTVARPQLTGSVEPVESKTTLYYWLYTMKLSNLQIY
jgi:hypothetical protein